MDAKRWQQITGAEICVAVNMSAIQFRDKSLLESVERILAESELPGELLELELTESVLLRSTPAVREAMVQMHEDLGISLTLDDVGRGFSSLEYLCKMPFDKMKVDRSFVLSSAADPSSKAIASAIISLGLKLGLTVVAEGVETVDQLQFLRQEGCPMGQGYLFSEPVSQSELTCFFERHGSVLSAANWRRLGS
jgi:EAL domain-containing protein (putative c-di-GMP-specific phosphodiesterase class I)